MSLRNLVFAAAAALPLAAAVSAPAEVLEIVGTGDGAVVLNALATVFTAQHPDVEVQIPKSIGSGGAMKAVGTDKNVLGRVARGIKDKEKPYGLEYRAFARVPVVFFVHPEVAAENLTTTQVLDIYSGKVTTWDEIGAGTGKIRVVRREDGDSSLDSLQKSLPGFADITLLEKSKTANSTPEAFSTVEKTKGAIGFGPYDVAISSDVKVLTLDGKAPLTDAYPCLTTLGLVYKPANRTGAVAAFLDFTASDAALAVLPKTGARGPN
ncbi:MAG: substrate-binding domain-containing protein [Deferrisomatales bacterium]|nr:substrate-binding domain-containing protein [Deferrisomatales bacterium]